MNNKAQLRWKLAFCLWLVVVTIATHMPAAEPSENPSFIAPDKLFHFVSFGVLSFALWNCGWTKHRWTVVRIMIGWAIFDEFTQAMLPLDRPFSVADITASMLGIIAAASWMGALSIDQLTSFRKKIDNLLSQTVSWVVLCPVAIVGTIGISAVIWSVLRKQFQASYAPLALCIGLLLNAFILLAIVSVWCKLPAKRIVAKMIPKILVVGIISILIGLVIPETAVGSYTIALTIFTIACSRVWHVTITDNAFEKTI